MRICPACTFENDDDASACDVCDEPLEAAAAPAAAAPAAAPVNAVERWHQEGLRLIARETDDRIRTLLRSNLAALVEALPPDEAPPVATPRRRVARAPAARRRAPAPAPAPERRDARPAQAPAPAAAPAATPSPPRRRRRASDDVVGGRTRRARRESEPIFVERGYLETYPSVDAMIDTFVPASLFTRRAAPADAVHRFRALAAAYLRLDVKCVFDARAFSCGPGGPELRLAADAPADVLTLLAAPPDDAYVVAYLKEELLFDRLGLASGDDVLDAVPRLGGAEAGGAVEAVGTWLTPMPGGRVGGEDRWSLPDPSGRDLQVFWSVGATDSGTHRDETESVLIVVSGRKTVHLWHERAPCGIGAGDRNRSLDTERPDGSLVLDAGAALHIPKGMWHRISSAAGTLAFSVRVADATAFAACK